MIFRLTLALACAAVSAEAAEVAVVSYSELLTELSERVDFERLPQRPEPGFNLDLPLYARGAWLGERFEGQQLAIAPTGHDSVEGTPAPGTLKVTGGLPRQNLNVAFHRGFGSNAIFPLGADGFPEITARGEGALAIVFDNDQAALGFRVHTDYPDPLGSRPTRRGEIHLWFHNREGGLIARLTLSPGDGITDFGFRRQGGGRDIAGILILNSDPGGIAIDDIIFAMPPLLG